MTHALPSPARPLRIGTRGSVLALAQALEARARLMAAHCLPEAAFTVIAIRTTGDRVQDRPLGEIGGKGLFTKEIEAALATGEIDLAVHSMKDVAVARPAGLTLECLLAREDPRDAFVAPALAQAGGPARLADLAPGTIVGTSSLRRRAQLLHRRPDLVVVEFRGNVQTRLQKLAAGVAACTFLAMAGLNRLGMAEVAQAPIEPDAMLPAIAQGAIGLERRTGDTATAALLEPLHDAPTALQLAAERAFLAALDGSCQTPIAGLALLDGADICLRGEILRPDGSEALADAIRGPAGDGAALGRTLAHRLLARAGPGFLAGH